jgi:hypothetical protein
VTQEIRHTLVLLAIAASFLGTGIWQTHAARARDLAKLQQSLPHPEKTRQAVRPASIPFSGAPVADYEARCKKGMTDQEIHWILEDYKNAGLDHGIHDIEIPDSGPPSEDPYRPHHDTLRKAQDRWFLEALADGLRLSPEQIAQARTSFDRLFDEAKAEFIQEQNADLQKPPQGSLLHFRAVDRLAKIVSPHRFLDGDEYIPWILCPLSPQQEKLTWKEFVSRRADQSVTGQDHAVMEPADVAPEFLGTVPRPFYLLMDPKVPLEYCMPNLFLPFLKTQKLAIGEDPFAEENDPPLEHEVLLAEYQDRLISNVRQFHPAQLKMALLYDPEMAGRLQHALEGRSH